MAKTTKLSTKEQANILISEGTIKEIIGYQNPTYIVESHGHTYQIENVFTKPKIKQLSQEVTNEQNKINHT